MVTAPSISLTDGNISFDMQEKTYQGPITRSYAKQIQNQVNVNFINFKTLYFKNNLVTRKYIYKQVFRIVNSSI